MMMLAQLSTTESGITDKYDENYVNVTDQIKKDYGDIIIN
jgi:hypothetical protein